VPTARIIVQRRSGQSTRSRTSRNPTVVIVITVMKIESLRLHRKRTT
jgi:hypothetical protein